MNLEEDWGKDWWGRTGVQGKKGLDGEKKGLGRPWIEWIIGSWVVGRWWLSSIGHGCNV
uniref:Uncharacterized protein n=1 Tax=Aegilops tauschii subsp. strangulata TaxID=200361 RepID=A0A453B460_AEGTS